MSLHFYLIFEPANIPTLTMKWRLWEKIAHISKPHKINRTYEIIQKILFLFDPAMTIINGMTKTRRNGAKLYIVSVDFSVYFRVSGGVCFAPVGWGCKLKFNAARINNYYIRNQIAFSRYK